MPDISIMHLGISRVTFFLSSKDFKQSHNSRTNNPFYYPKAATVDSKRLCLGLTGQQNLFRLKSKTKGLPLIYSLLLWYLKASYFLPMLLKFEVCNSKDNLSTSQKK
jgi:hypothetical protein